MCAAPSSTLSVLRAWLGQVMLDGLYPRVCWSCSSALPVEAAREGQENWLCASCRQELVSVASPYCAVCGEPFDGALDTPFRCSNCEGRRTAFDFAIASHRAAGPLREMIHRFKYGRDLSLRGVMAELLQEALSEPRLATENLHDWLLVPVPLHGLREFWRGFNQSWELCRQLSARTGIPAAQALRRVQFTRTQARLDRRQRLANLRGAFALQPARLWRSSPDLRGRRVLLVDDVLTTGATANECARVLKRQGGAEKVVVITVARG